MDQIPNLPLRSHPSFWMELLGRFDYSRPFVSRAMAYENISLSRYNDRERVQFLNGILHSIDRVLISINFFPVNTNNIFAIKVNIGIFEKLFQNHEWINKADS